MHVRTVRRTLSAHTSDTRTRRRIPGEGVILATRLNTRRRTSGSHRGVTRWYLRDSRAVKSCPRLRVRLKYRRRVYCISLFIVYGRGENMGDLFLSTDNPKNRFLLWPYKILCRREPVSNARPKRLIFANV